MTTRNRFVAALSVFDTPGVWPAIWCVVGAAIYGCVPETDQMEGIAVVLVAALAYELIARRRMPWGMHTLVAAVLLWGGMYGATGRERAFVGALFAFWPAVIVPLMALAGLPVMRRAEPVRWLIAALGGAAALIVSRTGALEPGWGPALRSVAIWGPSSLAAALVVLAVTARWRSPSQS